jgi:peptidylprolyl isomerase
MNKGVLTALLVSGLVSSTAGSAFAAPATASADWRVPDPENVLVVETNRGRIIAELIPEAAPNHVARIKELTRKGLYDGRSFFRVIDQFMAQTGDPKDDGSGGSDLADLESEFTWRRGAGSGFRAFATPTGAETGFVGSMPAISQSSSLAAMTSDGKISAWGAFCPGVLGMARAGDPDSANSQFFFMRQAYPSLEKRYTAFGQVLDGLAVVRAIKVGEPVSAPQDRMTRVRVLADIPVAERPMIRVADTSGPAFKATVDQVRAQRGADFSICDVPLAVEVK